MEKVDKCVQILREQEEQIKDLKFRVKKLKHKNRALEIKMQGNQQGGFSADNDFDKKEIKVESDPTVEVDDDFQMTFEDSEPKVRRERFDGQENSSGIQSPTQSKKSQAALKNATATDSEKLQSTVFREGLDQGMIELMKKYDVDHVDCVFKVGIKRSKKSDGDVVWNKPAVKIYLNVE